MPSPLKRSTSYIGLVASLAVGALIALAGSYNSVSVGGLRLFALCGLLAYVVNWVAFVPAWRARTEHFFDLTGSATYLSLMLFSLIAAGRLSGRSILVASLVMIWALRLGSFLFARIRGAGKDGRFDRMKHDFWRFLMTWTLQGLWVLLTASASLVGITSQTEKPLGVVAIVGLVVWIVGFSLEVVADNQKSRFKADPANDGRFITTGLWSWSRHPNYFGEIMLWAGIAIIAIPVMERWQFAALISPVFVFVLLTRISGVPLLERRADKKWGGEPAYEQYKRQTSELVLRPPRN